MNQNDAKFIVAEERFLAEIQFSLQWLMRDQGVNNKELAARLGVSAARVSQYFSEAASLNARTIARLFSALGEECNVESARLTDLKKEWKRHAASVSAEELVTSDMAYLKEEDAEEDNCDADLAPDSPFLIVKFAEEQNIWGVIPRPSGHQSNHVKQTEIAAA
ncbi:helix-turn-helix transcriptional regulator [Iodidimonas sp. SYSU 1G8]|uniref:helix-turn-helix transcriptional regulator n=1 Tax=Iodidimonas sp. SYSU 1G8 TaxID=3133967 RepID=UPI0031FF3922